MEQNLTKNKRVNDSESGGTSLLGSIHSTYQKNISIENFIDFLSKDNWA